MTTEERIKELAQMLEEEDRRTCLVNYWFKTMGGGWVEPDWERIASIALTYADEEVL